MHYSLRPPNLSDNKALLNPFALRVDFRVERAQQKFANVTHHKSSGIHKEPEPKFRACTHHHFRRILADKMNVKQAQDVTDLILPAGFERHSRITTLTRIVAALAVLEAMRREEEKNKEEKEKRKNSLVAVN
jgi:hypothetical protein